LRARAESGKQGLGLNWRAHKKHIIICRGQQAPRASGKPTGSKQTSNQRTEGIFHQSVSGKPQGQAANSNDQAANYKWEAGSSKLHSASNTQQWASGQLPYRVPWKVDAIVLQQHQAQRRNHPAIEKLTV